MTCPHTRARVVTAAARVLTERGSKAGANPLATAEAIADALDLRRHVVSEPPPAAARDASPSPAAATALDLGVWIDDPPSLVLDGPYLDRLLELPLGHVAVMVDGPIPGLGDARWDWRDLERLRRRLPDRVYTVLTVWMAPQREAIDELAERVPRLLEALGSRVLEGDYEPAGHWQESGVSGYDDVDRDGRRLDDAVDALADMLLELDVEALETTTFPGALRLVAPLLERLAAWVGAGPELRYYGQHYPVRHRQGREIPWNDPLGPERFPGDAHAGAVRRLPPEVEVCAGLAAYDTDWPGGRDGLTPALRGARAAGAARVRYWSSKWLARKNGHAKRRELIRYELGA